MTHHINCWSVLHIGLLMSKRNDYVRMLLTNNTIESKHPNRIISQWWNTNENTCLRCLPSCISAPLHTRYSVLFGQSASVHCRPFEKSSSSCQFCAEDL